MIRLNYRSNPSVRSFSQPFTGQQTYPGAADSFFGGGGGSSLTPTQAMPTQLSPVGMPEVIPAATGTGAAAGSGFSLKNLNDLKGIIDRMGGIDGIINTMGKVQKVVAGVQQIAPMVKLIMGSFGKKGAAAKSGGDDWSPPRRRRRRRRRGSGSTRRRKGPDRRRRRGRR
nr:tyrosine protein kinase [Paenibacillus abyssi]